MSHHVKGHFVLILPKNITLSEWDKGGFKGGLIIALPIFVAKEMGSVRQSWSGLLANGHTVIVGDNSPEFWVWVQNLNDLL